MRENKMDNREILQYIDRGANFYLSLFGNAKHMENVHKEFYSYVQPRGDEYGVRYGYNIRLDDCPPERRLAVAEEIKSLHMPVWVDLTSSDEAFYLIFGREKAHGQRELAPNDEVYMAMLPEELPDYPKAGLNIQMVLTPDQFASWASVCNRVLSNGRQDIHLENHYRLCQEERLRCYMGIQEGRVVSVAAIARDGEAASLEFVATLDGMRRRGFASEVCRRAVADAFRERARIVTVRAIDGAAAELYRSLRFTTYNDAV